jgi:hypothetical protein
MTIDERLEKLTERHEAFVQSMELANHEWNARFSRLLSLVETDAANIRSLARVAEAHEHRLDNLEDRR